MSEVNFPWTDDQVLAVQAMGYKMESTHIFKKRLAPERWLWLVAVAYPQEPPKWHALTGDQRNYNQVTRTVPIFDDILSAAVFCETLGGDVQ